MYCNKFLKLAIISNLKKIIKLSNLLYVYVYSSKHKMTAKERHRKKERETEKEIMRELLRALLTEESSAE